MPSSGWWTDRLHFSIPVYGYAVRRFLNLQLADLREAKIAGVEATWENCILDFITNVLCVIFLG